MKIWTSNEKKDDKIIALSDEYIYKGNPPSNEIGSSVFDLEMKTVPLKHFFAIPLSYISAINLQEGKKYIEVLFRGDYEHLKIMDDKTRVEVFEFFKHNIPGASFQVIKEPKFKSIRKPLIAMTVIAVIFCWSLFIAIGMESGNKYDVTGQHYHSIAGIILLIASLGVIKIILIFGSLFFIVGISLIRKYKNPVVKNTIIIKR